MLAKARSSPLPASLECDWLRWLLRGHVSTLRGAKVSPRTVWIHLREQADRNRPIGKSRCFHAWVRCRDIHANHNRDHGKPVIRLAVEGSQVLCYELMTYSFVDRIVTKVRKTPRSTAADTAINMVAQPASTARAARSYPPGIHVPSLTWFGNDARQEIDWNVQTRHFDFLVEGGVTGGMPSDRFPKHHRLSISQLSSLERTEKLPPLRHLRRPISFGNCGNEPATSYPSLLAALAVAPGMSLTILSQCPKLVLTLH